MARTALRTSPWLAAQGDTYQLMVTDAGYVLVSGGKETEEKTP
jgi:hypothetical protein